MSSVIMSGNLCLIQKLNAAIIPLVIMMLRPRKKSIVSQACPHPFFTEINLFVINYAST